MTGGRPHQRCRLLGCIENLSTQEEESKWVRAIDSQEFTCTQSRVRLQHLVGLLPGSHTLLPQTLLPSSLTPI